MTAKKSPAPRVRVKSPVIEVTRKVKDLTRLLLFVRAGGRCEFDGCNKYLLENPLTLTEGNFAQMAHVVAFRAAGPRGQDGERPLDINRIENLLLLCHADHKEIDDHPARYTRKALEAYKAAHESRIRHVTSLGPNRKTAVLVFKARIGDHTVSVPFDQVIEATSPRFPTSTHPPTIDLTEIPVADGAFLKTAMGTIKHRLNVLFGPEGEATTAGHLSVFALGPIPLLICLGRNLSNKVPSDLFQRHRDTENWTWKGNGKAAEYQIRLLKSGKKDRVAVVMSLSGRLRLKDLPTEAIKGSTVYELTLKGQVPNPTFLRQRQDLERFRLAFQRLIATILDKHGLVPTIDLFPAIPAPVAVLCGRELLPKVHPKLRIFDFDKAQSGFRFKLEV